MTLMTSEDALVLVNRVIDDRSGRLIAASDHIHDFAELSYEEFQSMEELTSFLRDEGFAVETGLAEMPTCFTGTFGSGKPVVGILGEFDALDKLSQKGGVCTRSPLKEGAPGHGCGHCALGAGSLGAALAVKEYLKESGREGTVIYFGCPAEEGAGAKQFMARAGMFDHVDFVYTWHPYTLNIVANASSNAIMGANFEFFGKAAHAGGCPWAGRSALDAAELMSVGCNYLREHIEDGQRIHYAYADAGGTAPNVVQDYAKVKYEVRAPKVSALTELFGRVVKVAKGAAMMTETEMSYEITMAFCDFSNNSVLAEVASECFTRVGAPKWEEEDYQLAKAYLDSYDETTRAVILKNLHQRFGKAALPEILERPLHQDIITYDQCSFEQQGGSTDVGDVSYTVPTCEVQVACACLGNIGHTWQMAGQAGSRLAHKGLLVAAKVLALSCISMMNRPDLIEEAKEEALERNGGAYRCPLPDSVKPPVGKY